MSRLLALLVLLAGRAAAGPAGLCALPFCKCPPAQHPSWTIVNCTVPHNQNLIVKENDLPESTTDFMVTGGEAVMFARDSLSALKDIRHVNVTGVGVVVIRTSAANNLNIVSVFLEVNQCDTLSIEEKAFSNIKGPLSVSVNNCQTASLQSQAFSWLLSLKIENVETLNLSPEVFVLDPSAANVGDHGPGMKIELEQLSIPRMDVQTFGSSAASIIMRSVQVETIASRAFSANTYNIVMAINTTFNLIEKEAFDKKSLINNLYFDGCKIHQISSKALESAVANLNISRTRFKNIETGAVAATVATVTITESEFNRFMERGFELSSWSSFRMERNKFDEVAPYAIIAPGSAIHDLIFADNEIETPSPRSFAFIGNAYANFPGRVQYRNNYYGQPCNCNASYWLSKVLDTQTVEVFETESYCTVHEFFARCFNVPEQNMVVQKFIENVCTDKSTIKCEAFKNKNDGETTEIKNPRFPHKRDDDDELSYRNKKIIAIVLGTVLGCIALALLFSLIRWMRRRGHCVNIKNFVNSSNTRCGSLCDRLCTCGANNGLDNARSISQLSVNEYSERHRLNEPRVQEMIQETTLPDMYTENVTSMDDKTTQTLPEELTKELLENLREKLEDPENYVEAREMIEHLYELIKVEESCNVSNSHPITEENIYELPFQNTAPRIGRNKKKMISVGTRTPSLDKLLPLSPYNRQTALAHEYFEPKDFAVHLYAEIANNEHGRRHLMGVMPDVIQGDQAVPRGPYLRAVREKAGSTPNTSPSTKSNSSASSTTSPTIKSNRSISSNSSRKMTNRPLPEKPSTLDPGEGTSIKHG